MFIASAVSNVLALIFFVVVFIFMIFSFPKLFREGMSWFRFSLGLLGFIGLGVFTSVISAALICEYQYEIPELVRNTYRTFIAVVEIMAVLYLYENRSEFRYGEK